MRRPTLTDVRHALEYGRTRHPAVTPEACRRELRRLSREAGSRHEYDVIARVYRGVVPRETGSGVGGDNVTNLKR